MPLIRDYVGDGDWVQLGSITNQWITFATTTTAPPYIWGWNETGNTTLSSYHGWTSSTTTTTGNYFHPLTYNGASLSRIEPVEVTPEEMARTVAEIEAAAEEVARERDARRTARTLATERGEALLLSLLDNNQREAYRQDREFAVIGSHGTVYRIKHGTSGNIEWLKPNGSLGGRLCAHPSMHEEWIPTEDVMLAQVLALITDEREFCRVANVHLGQRPPVLVAA